MAKGITLDCKCEGSRRLNEMKQKSNLVRKMQNPVVVHTLTNRPTQTYQVNKRDGDEGKDDVVTGFVYNFGGSITHQCVDERDAPRILSRVANKQRLFEVEKNHNQPDPIEEAVKEGKNDIKDPFGSQRGDVDTDVDTATDPDVDLTRDEKIAQFETITGIGNKTAILLVDNDYTVAELQTIDIDNVVHIASIAEGTDVAPALIAKIITSGND